ncbi:phosphopantetheine-binding protein [Fulvivirgaceae bacterium BMA12]|uniref:Phosphopantetheine-binding protein n=1 Tax=Agaribacillus aureus TaxID=3051825 RepID=A0ABT8LF55_9BACT|nr:phosphopantetheine-binding protein [Fulvivirgaceae bacterium BMA12]
MKHTLAEILSDVLSREVSPDALNEQSDLMTDLGLNSLDLLQFIVKIEEAFDIEINIESLDLKYFNKLELLQSFILEMQGNKDVI